MTEQECPTHEPEEGDVIGEVIRADGAEETLRAELTPEEQAAALLAETNAALSDVPFQTENVTVAVTRPSYTLNIQPDITPEESTRLALFVFAQVLAKQPEIGITVNGMLFEQFSRHFTKDETK